MPEESSCAIKVIAKPNVFHQTLLIRLQMSCLQTPKGTLIFQQTMQVSYNFQNVGMINLWKIFVGIDRSEFQQRRSTLAHHLASQGSLLALDKTTSSFATSTVANDKTKNHLVIIPSSQRKYMVDKIPFWPFRQATDFRYLTVSFNFPKEEMINSWKIFVVGKQKS